MPDIMPDFQILVAGKPLDIDPRHLNRLIVDESLEMTAKCEFSVQHSHSFVLRPEWMKSGMHLEVRMGYIGDLVKVFGGDIASIEPEFPDGGNPSITITAYDLSYKLKRIKQTRVFSQPSPRPGANVSSPDDAGLPQTGNQPSATSYHSIVRYIVNDPKMNYGLQLRLAPSAILGGFALGSGQSYSVDDITDWESLTRFAEIGDYNLFARFGFGHDDPSRNYLYMVDDNYLLEQQDYRLRMIYNPGPDDLRDITETPLLKFDPKFEIAGKRGSIEVAGWGNINLPEVYGRSGLSDIGQEGLMQIWEGVEKIASRQLPANKPETSYQAKVITSAELRRRLKNLISGDATIAGDAHIHIGQQHEIVLNALGDFGKQYSGKYMLKRVVHSISPDDGYKTTFDVRRGGLTCYTPLNVEG